MGTAMVDLQVGLPTFIVEPVKAIGVDPGLTLTGICKLDFDGRDLFVTYHENIKAPTGLSLRDRIDFIANEVVVQSGDRDIITIEDCFVGPNPQGALKQSELIGVLWDRIQGLTSVRIAPRSVKKMFTGNGNAGKPKMIEEAERRLGVTLRGSKVARETYADSFAIAMSGLNTVHKFNRWADRKVHRVSN